VTGEELVLLTACVGVVAWMVWDIWQDIRFTRERHK
jgi:hypothetical protein